MDVTNTHRKTPNTPQMSQVRRPFLCWVTVTMFCRQWGHVVRPGTSLSCGTMATTTGTEKTASNIHREQQQQASGWRWAHHSYDPGEGLTRLGKLRLLCRVHVDSLSCWMWGEMVSIRRLTPHNISPFKSTKPEPTLKKSKKFPITPKTQTPAEICCSFSHNEGFTVDDISLIIFLSRCCIIWN